MHKGLWSYEFEILMIVFNWAFDMEFYENVMVNFKGIHIGRLTIWINNAWWTRPTPSRIRYFFISLFRNTDRFKSRRSKLRVVWINTKSMFRRWISDIKKERAIRHSK